MQTLNSNNYGVTLSEAHDCIRSLQPFHTGTLNGAWEPDGEEYVVRSYGVPIAVWEGTASEANTACVLDDAYHYSVTTSKHANIVKMAWGLN